MEFSIPHIGFKMGSSNFAGTMMEETNEIKNRDLKLLAGIVRGPGNYPTPSLERIERLVDKGLVTRKKGRLYPTIKGRVIAWLNKSA